MTITTEIIDVLPQSLRNSLVTATQSSPVNHRYGYPYLSPPPILLPSPFTSADPPPSDKPLTQTIIPSTYSNDGSFRHPTIRNISMAKITHQTQYSFLILPTCCSLNVGESPI
ncbi:hypothetical protein RND81_08G133400 [Saponaria officinalis]|uniref:Uncharacterized protein n=1 Tax=Saponaria officinalis TaxID=3572 RepID=A0AAW1J7X4_SAPOF